MVRKLLAGLQFLQKADHAEGSVSQVDVLLIMTLPTRKGCDAANQISLGFSISGIITAEKYWASTPIKVSDTSCQGGSNLSLAIF